MNARSPSCPLSSRRGSSIAEALTAMLLMVLVMGAGLRSLATLRRTAANLTSSAELRETERIARHTLRQELRAGLADVDWGEVAGDSLALRAFRGTGVVCRSAPLPSGQAVRYTGLRRPNPAKDSVLLLTRGGVWQVSRLVQVRNSSDACGAGAPGDVWTLDPPAPDAVVARIFERGSYHLAARVLRYRPGSGGRQPLTAEMLRTEGNDASGFAVVGAGILLHLAFNSSRVTVPPVSSLVWARERWP